MTDALIWVIAAVAILAAVGLATLWLLTRSRREADELRRRVDARQSLISGGREAVKTVWETLLTASPAVKRARQTANLVRNEGFGAAVRSSIEELADWAKVQRPDLARLTSDWAKVQRPDLARLSSDWAKVEARSGPAHPGRQRGDPVLRHRGVDRAERADG